MPIFVANYRQHFFQPINHGRSVQKILRLRETFVFLRG